ncbi:MAG: proline--tRNA ligase [Anaerolineaceae bacterium]|nr:proline--tRNA ligase [Anaerolineaceae bacterium]
MDEKKLPSRSENFSEWYNQLVLRAELADYSPVRGCMVVRPYGWAIWENIQNELNKRFKATGHVNAAFPMLIPQSYMTKEKEHVEGFSPELAVVTHGGGQELEEPLVVRPTSETIIGTMYSKWVQSYRDLPILINQWANVVRWEMRTKLFLRTLEFYWQEGHTAHATEQEAVDETERMLEVYTDFARNEAAVPVLPGQKSETEKFAGAKATYSIEAMMGDTKALQAGTSHFLGQNFAEAFDIKFLDEDNQLKFAWTTSWGVSTRFIGAMIMTHGDDQGLILPPHLAPYQVVIVPIYRKDEEKESVMAMVKQVANGLTEANVRVKVDERDGMTPGFKFNDWEMKGVPLRIEIGPKDVEKGSLALARRDILGRDGKSFIPMEGYVSSVKEMLETIQTSLLDKATKFRDEHIFEVSSYDELKDVVENKGWAVGWWYDDRENEAKIKEDTRATLRNFAPSEGEGICFFSGKKTTKRAYFAKGY